MKTERVVIGVLAVLVLLLGGMQLFGGKKPATEKTVVEMWHTNTVEMWHTNTVDKWCTNVTEVTSTNTVIQPVTNVVVKEVAARISPQVRQAATLGYKYSHAPALNDPTAALYKVGPVGVEVVVEDTALDVTGDADNVRRTVEEVLKSRQVPVAAKSPYTLHLKVASSWRTSVPRTALLNYRLELRDAVALERRNDLLKCGGVVWSTANNQLTRTGAAAQDVKGAIQDAVLKFCKDYAKAKDTENQLEARIPTVPSDFLPAEN